MAKSTVEKGLGNRHKEAARYLKQRHVDGSPCDWCGRPMWLDPTKNHDYDWSNPTKHVNGVLQADHSKTSRSESIRRGEPVLPPDRLLHAECNRQRGAGMNDHLAFSSDGTENLSMPWPW